MIEYPTIMNSSKAPREPCLAFDKLDGSNFRAKWTQKQGFNLFGTRTQLINENTPFWSEMISIFKSTLNDKLEQLIKDNFRNERQIVVFGEFLGENSFAGFHVDEPHQIIIIDILVGHKNPFFIKPREFAGEVGKYVSIPRIIHDGNLSNQFINDVREDRFGLKEGVICKGLTTSGAYRGKIWMCKIKTNLYRDKIRAKFNTDWIKYWE